MAFGLVTKRVIIYEAFAFGIVIAFLWADELFDLPHNIFGTQATPFNWSESIIESGFVLLLAVATIYLSNYYLGQIKHLEGILPVCASCKKIKDGEEWVPFEQYVKQHSAADFSHGLCPDCAKPYYEELERMSESKPDPRD